MLGDGTKRAKAKTEAYLEKTVHVMFTAVGDGVDQVEWLSLLANAGGELTPFVISSGEIKLYFKKKEKQ